MRPQALKVLSTLDLYLDPTSSPESVRGPDPRMDDLGAAHRNLIDDGTLDPPTLRLPVRALSMAQSCNEDVIEEILSLLPQATLASAARVCRSWLPSARRHLYRALEFRSTSSSAHILAQTLSSNAYLRALIRRPTVFHLANRDVSTLRWLALLPEHSLQSITFLGQILDCPDSEYILNLPSVCTTKRIIGRNRPALPTLRTLLNMAQLVSLSIIIRPHFPSLTNITLPNLQRLSIIVSKYTSSSVDVILKGLSQPLVRFDLKSIRPLEEKDIFALQDSLIQHAPHLQHLSFEGNPYFFPRPFVDDYIVTFTSLRTLFCSDRSYSPQIFSRIPSTLESLTLRAPTDESFADAALAEALEQHLSQLVALSRVKIVDDPMHRVSCDALAKLCRLRGIYFTIERDEEDYYFFS